MIAPGSAPGDRASIAHGGFAFTSLKTVVGASDRPLFGMFISSGSATAAEICAGSDLDFLLIDSEHGAMGLESLQAQLRAIAAYPTVSVVRIPVNDPVVIKQVLELGAQTLVVPMVDSPAEAVAAVASMRYAPAGVRGVGSSLARSGRWGRTPQYAHHAETGMTLLVQIESLEAAGCAYDIAAVDGVDGVFIGPADLAATMGLLGQQDHPDVTERVLSTMAAVQAAGKLVGVNAFSPAQAERYLAAGADFVNVGADVTLLAQGSDALAARHRSATEQSAAPLSETY